MNLIPWQRIVQGYQGAEYEGTREYVVAGIGRVLIEERDIATAALLGGNPLCSVAPANFTYNARHRYFHIRSFYQPGR